MNVSMTTVRVVRRAVRQAVAILQIQVERKWEAEEGAFFLCDFLVANLHIDIDVRTISGSSNTGAIVGGVIGGVVALAALILALFFFRRRSQNKQSTKERPVDLLQDDDDTGHRGELPQYYQPEPFMMPEPSARVSTDAGSIAAQTDDRGRPLSGVTSTSRSGTPDLLGFGAAGTAATSTSGSSSGRKSGMPRPLRAVNIIQHEDAGPSDAPKADEDEPETIELPPAYTNIRSETPTRPA